MLQLTTSNAVKQEVRVQRYFLKFKYIKMVDHYNFNGYLVRFNSGKESYFQICKKKFF